MDSIIVYGIGLIAVLFIGNKVYKSLSGKSTGCSGCGSSSSGSSSGCGCGCGCSSGASKEEMK